LVPFRNQGFARRIRSLAGHRCHADAFAGFTFGDDLERTAANLAVRCELLAGEARVNRHGKRLAAERALDVGEFFHAGKLAAAAQSAIPTADRWSPNPNRHINHNLPP